MQHVSRLQQKYCIFYRMDDSAFCDVLELIVQDFDDVEDLQVWAAQNGVLNHPAVQIRVREIHLLNENQQMPSTSFRAPPASPLKQYRCRTCSQVCEGRRALYQHKVSQHGHTGSTSSLSPIAAHSADGHLPSSSPRSPADTSSLDGEHSSTRLTCHACGHKCINQSELYRHRMQQHGRGEGLQPVPWEEGNSPFEDEPDDSLKDEYETNIQHILKPHELGEIASTYNFPTNNLAGGVEEIMNNVRTIYATMKNEFKLNLSFGLILKNVETGKFRYFIPYRNTTVFEFPITISNQRDMLKLRQKLEDMNIVEYASMQRDSTNWRPHLVTNMNLYVTRTAYVLGSVDKLPDYIVNCHFIIGMKRKLTNPGRGCYNDNLCVFRCLVYHTGNLRNFETRVKEAYETWRAYVLEENKTKLPENPKHFRGISLTEIPQFEKCFSMNVDIYQMLPDRSVSPIYQSQKEFIASETLYLNVYENHFSYVTNFSKYAKKLQCTQCSRNFYHLGHLKRHMKCCGLLTKCRYLGGFFRVFQTIFQRLEQYNIRVEDNNRCNTLFSVFDLEALLTKVDHISESPSKTKYIIRHEPISVSICSNIPGFTKPSCFINVVQEELVENMIKYLCVLSDAAFKLNKDKFNDVFIKLDALLEKWRPVEEEGDEMDNEDDDGDDEDYDEEEVDDQESIHEDDFTKTSSRPTLVKNIQYNKVKKLCDDFTKYCQQLIVIGFNSGEI
jgi:hypothetical protein